MIRSVGIISKPRPDEVRGVAGPLVEWLAPRVAEIRMDHETACALGQKASGVGREEFSEGLDLVIVLGGDGTLLAAARALDGDDVPVLPVNLGTLGFLTSISRDKMYDALSTVLGAQQVEERRRMLQVDLVRDGGVIAMYHALNDAVLNKSAIARMLDFEVLVDGQAVSNYKADGMILSTPTGSTGYSMAAGGPIVYPSVQALIITSICSHTLNHRPLVVPDDRMVEVIVHANHDAVHLTVDGQVDKQLRDADRIVCRRSPRTLRLVRPQTTGYFDILRNKLSWGQR